MKKLFMVVVIAFMFLVPTMVIAEPVIMESTDELICDPSAEVAAEPEALYTIWEYANIGDLEPIILIADIPKQADGSVSVPIGLLDEERIYIVAATVRRSMGSRQSDPSNFFSLLFQKGKLPAPLNFGKGN